MMRRRSSERESKVRGSRAVMVGREAAKLGGDEEEEEEDEGEKEAEVRREASKAKKERKDSRRLLHLIFYF